MEPSPHVQLEPLSFLLGTWRGRGRGRYPTIDDFTYEEESTFTHTGRPFLVYSQRTWHPDSKQPMHSETGFVRALGEQRVEIVISHAFGIAEVGEGKVWENQLETRTTSVFGTSTAKHVGAVTRSLDLRREVLHYTIGMQFGEHQLQDHLFAELRRAD